MMLPRPPPRFALDAAPPEQAFRFRGGESARSLAELADVLARATPADVAFHRDHFAPWIEAVVGDAPLARRFAYYARQGGDASVLRDTLAALARRRVRELG